MLRAKKTTYVLKKGSHRNYDSCLVGAKEDVGWCYYRATKSVEDGGRIVWMSQQKHCTLPQGIAVCFPFPTDSQRWFDNRGPRTLTGTKRFS